MPKQSAKERLEKKRLAEQRRRAKIKKDSTLHNEVKAKARARYYKRKAEGKIIPLSKMEPIEKKRKREQNRINGVIFRQRKKDREKRALDEDMIICKNVPTTSKDPLSSAPASPTRTVTPPHFEPFNQSSPISRPCTRLSKQYKTINSVDRSMFSSDEDPPTPKSCLTTSKTRKTAILGNNEQLFSSRSSTPISFSNDDAGPSHDNYDHISRYSSCSVSSVSSKSDGDSSSTQSSSRDSPNLKVNKRKSNEKFVPNKLKYKAAKDYKLMHKRIHELKNLNSKYRKQLWRMKNFLNAMKDKKTNTDTDTSNINEDEETEIRMRSNVKTKLEEDVKNFFLDDENSRMCAGKKECITKNKVKKQKRYLTDTTQNIHSKFLRFFPQYRISYSHFCKLRPFWVLSPSIKDRDTCLCKPHSNMELLITALRRYNIISENSTTDVLKTVCCNSANLNCLSRKCHECKDKKIVYKEFDDSSTIYYWAWKKSKIEYVKDGQVKSTFRTAKEKIVAAAKDVINEFEKQLNPFIQHCHYIIAQHSHVKHLKKNLTDQEAIIHCDFSENYGTKYTNEIQAFHFGSSRIQITLHTVVIYFLLKGNLQAKSFCTLSKCLRHDAVAIWQHLIPVLSYIKANAPTVTRLHFISDSPSAQYRNRKMFFIIAKLYWDFTNINFVSWNYSESGHGKGAPDGVGGVLKRTADQIVARGCDIPDLETLMQNLKQNVKGVVIEEVEEAGIFEKEMLIPPKLPNFPGTMQIHQIVWDVNKRDILAMRKLSCNLDECAISAIECYHGQHIGFYHIEDPTNQIQPNEHNDDCEETNENSTIRSEMNIISDEISQLPKHIINKPQSENNLRITLENQIENKAAGTSKDLAVPSSIECHNGKNIGFYNIEDPTNQNQKERDNCEQTNEGSTKRSKINIICNEVIQLPQHIIKKPLSENNIHNIMPNQIEREGAGNIPSDSECAHTISSISNQIVSALDDCNYDYDDDDEEFNIF